MSTASPALTGVAGAVGGSGSGDGSGAGPTGSPGSDPRLIPLGLAAVIGAIVLMVVGRRRGRREDQATDVLEVALDVAVTDLATAPLAALTAIDEDLAPVDDDAPLKHARKTAASRTTRPVAADPAGPLRAFAKPPRKGVERAKVGYRRVRISSEPDAIRSIELGRLDRGDEVEILDSSEGFLHVRTPDDITGWILRHTIVGAPAT